MTDYKWGDLSDDDELLDSLPDPTLAIHQTEDEILEDNIVDDDLVKRMGHAELVDDDEVVVKGDDIDVVTSFEEMGVRDDIMMGIYEHGFDTPSKIQAASIPAILNNPDQNFVGQAPSGTGKTGAFVISMLCLIDEEDKNTQALLIAPTRELAIQIHDVVRSLSKKTNIESRVLIAGDRIIPGKKINSHIIIATPGKCTDALSKKVINIPSIKIVIWDEADFLAKDEFENVKKISSAIENGAPKARRCLFSATYPDINEINTFVPEPRIEFLMEKEALIHGAEYLPQFWISGTGDNEVARTPEEAIIMKGNVVEVILNNIQTSKSIIFCRTRSTANYLEQLFKKAQVPMSIGVLHGGLEKGSRDIIMSDFRSGNIRLLITTNVLARGIDVLNVSLVINFDIPVTYPEEEPDCDTYYHRVGRTGRFGAKGIAINIIHNKTTKERLDAIRNFYGSFQIEEIKRDWNIEIIDTPGSLESEGLANAIGEGQAFVILFSLSDSESYEQAQQLHDRIVAGKGDVPMILVGNKNDEERQVLFTDSKAKAEEWGIKYLEISAKESEKNLQDTFGELVSETSGNVKIAIVGGTNTGKTTIFNKLSHTKAETSPTTTCETKSVTLKNKALEYWCQNYSITSTTDA
eukprot:TRINITY_DN4321_c0_g1_i1.p1 TRINITY_DN4321_c0_g1~~TRINITY_DN4321_c0_g1_i1.p1  ORF type:complete len:642 (+),score=169.11 TRINITY_DN4321_c0_g1_i1:22-1926(+)